MKIKNNITQKQRMTFAKISAVRGQNIVKGTIHFSCGALGDSGKMGMELSSNAELHIAPKVLWDWRWTVGKTRLIGSG